MHIMQILLIYFIKWLETCKSAGSIYIYIYTYIQGLRKLMVLTLTVGKYPKQRLFENK